MSKQIERFFKEDANSLYRMVKSYLRLENSPFDFVNSNDPNRELIFCPTHTRSAAKSEMKASVIHRGKGSILRVTILGPWNAMLPKSSIQANGFLDGLAQTMPFLERITEDDMPDADPFQPQGNDTRMEPEQAMSPDLQTEPADSIPQAPTSVIPSQRQASYASPDRQSTNGAGRPTEPWQQQGLPRQGTNVPQGYITQPNTRTQFPQQQNPNMRQPGAAPSQPMVRTLPGRSKRIGIPVPAFIVMIIGDVLGVLFLLVCAIGIAESSQSTSIDFNTVEQECANKDDGTTMRVGDGGDSLSLSMSDYSEGKVFACVASEVDLPDSIRSKMESTRAIDGTQSDTWDGLRVTWSYQTGGYTNMLDVIIEKQR